MEPDFASMNETDVREIIVRPLLHRLGFKHGTQAHIRTEVTLRYDRAFLGRKNPSKDPPLTGRADYICDATSYGRWVVEVKAPGNDLTREDAEQAHTYSAHPEISASHFLLTNGRLFRLFSLGELDVPLLEWAYEETEQHLMTLFNIVGYEAIRKRSAIIRPDVSKPLAAGLSSRLKIVGGEIAYGEHHSDHPLLAGNALNGTIGAVTGVGVERIADGRIQATVSVRSAFQQFAELNRLAGMGDFTFLSGDEFVSTDRDRPTIFQNVIEGRLEPGATFRPMPGMPEIPLPVGFQFTVYTEATGYIEDGSFKGTLAFDYSYQFIRGRPTGIPALDQMAAQAPASAGLQGVGTFEVIVVEAPR